MKLPDRPSELLKLAMHDLELCEQDKQYTIHMGNWHLSLPEKCIVCAAGAVMAKSLKTPTSRTIEPSNFPYGIECKLEAINFFRGGDIYSALSGLDIPIPESLPDDYGLVSVGTGGIWDLSLFNRPEWKLHMATIIGILEEEGF